MQVLVNLLLASVFCIFCFSALRTDALQALRTSVSNVESESEFLERVDIDVDNFEIGNSRDLGNAPGYEYSESLAITSVGYAAIGICTDASIVTSWTCNMCTQGVYPVPAPPRLKDIVVVEDGDPTNPFSLSRAHAVVGVTEDESRIVLSFQGTVNILQVFEDIDIVPRDVKEVCGEGCLATHGFFDTYELISGDILVTVQGLLEKYSSAKEILLVGHSLGGALATHSAMQLSTALPVQQLGLNIFGYTFGQPRVGNKVFATYFNGLRDSGLIKAWHRVVNYHDPIPALIPKIDDLYYHVATEVWYFKKPQVSQAVAPGSYKILSSDDGEDENGQGGRCVLANPLKWCFNGDYHTTYMNLPEMSSGDVICQ